MPYIPNSNRLSLEKGYRDTETPGELNYQITQIVEVYRLTHGDRYATFNDIIGALECAKAEFQRRVIAPYEDIKCYENGDVYAPLEDA